MRSFALTIVAAFALAAPGVAQDVFRIPQPPCDLKPGHGLVSDGINHLKQAVENPAARRDQRLDQASENLVRAIRDQGQAANPAAWYYLGRYYAETSNLHGVDTAFARAEALAPECAADIAPYKAAMMSEALSAALAAWQSGSTDSANTMFDMAARLNAKDPTTPLYRGRMLAEKGQLDEAAEWVERGAVLAGNDPNHERLVRQARLDVVRGFGRTAQAEPAIQRIGASRVARDTLARNVRRDSTLLATLVQQWAGQNLRPEVRQAYVRDSTTLANRLRPAQAALPEARTRMANDSTAVARAVASGVRAYRSYVGAYPQDGDAALQLLTMYSAAGHDAAMTALIDQTPALDNVTEDELLRAGISLFNEGHPARSAQILERGLKRNPYNRGSLVVLCRSYFAMQDAAALGSAARRLIALDPLNPQSVRMMAAAFDLGGQRDSANAYVQRANGGMRWAVNIQQFLPTETTAVLNGAVQNIAGQALPAATLTIEFLSGTGQVLATQAVSVPGLPPQGQHAITARAEVGGAVGWRYRMN